MDYKIINTALMVKGKNYPEGSIISDSDLSKSDLIELSKFLKPLNSKPDNKDSQPGNSTTRSTRNSKDKNSKVTTTK